MALIELIDVYKIYGEGLESEVRALSGVSLKIERAEFVAIIGSSGSGKSTLMNIIGCLDAPTYGEYYFEEQFTGAMTDKELSRMRNREIGFVFQGFNLIPELNALENVELPLIYQGRGGWEGRERAKAALERVGLGERMRHKPSEMSGGQQQRVAIARAIATNPTIILADEPTGNLDSKTGEHVIDILNELNREGATIVLITHDNGVAASAKRIIRISDGKIVEDAPREAANL